MKTDAPLVPTLSMQSLMLSVNNAVDKSVENVPESVMAEEVASPKPNVVWRVR